MKILRSAVAFRRYAIIIFAMLSLLLLAFQLRLIPLGKREPIWKPTLVTSRPLPPFEDIAKISKEPIRKPTLVTSRPLRPFEDIDKISKEEPPLVQSGENDLIYLRQHALTGTQRIIPDMEGMKDWDLKRLQFSYHSYLDNIQVLCHRVMKIGERRWGNRVCDDDSIRPRQPCVGSSLAVAGDDINILSDVKRLYGCEIQDSSSLRNATVDVLRLDLEGEEWQTLAKMAASGELSRVRQLVVSLTTSQDSFVNDEKLRQRLQILTTLNDAGFRIFHSIMRENDPKVSNSYIVIRNVVYEVAFLNTKLFHEDSNAQDSPQTKDEHNMQVLRNLTLKDGRLPTRDRITSLSDMEVHYHYHRYLDNPSIQCALSLKMGQLYDGGYRVCDDEHFRPSKSCLVYSFGIQNEFSFDDDMAKFYGCDVFSFDPSMLTSHRRSSKVTFYSLGIGGTRDFTNDTDDNHVTASWRLERLSDIKLLLRHQGKPIDVLKIDVEGAEWPVVVDLSRSGELSLVRQLIIEFHVWDTADAEVVRRKLEVLTHLAQAGFRMFFSHPNWCTYHVSNVYPVKRTTCYENSFLNTRFEA